ncbi:MAG: DUF2878 domain-containing protein [Phycisphaerales bacterium]|nr:DUF2878 domain-containing protein [Phycisphaerales bacterium]
MIPKILNVVVFNVCWFACILGAGAGQPWIGVIAVVLSAAFHILLSKSRFALATLYLTSFLVGFAADTLVLSTGAMSFPTHAELILPVPLWMTFMWVNFATTLTLSMSWIRGRSVVAALFGLVGGPGAYYTGMKLDAVNLNESLWFALGIIGIQWAIALPILSLLADRLTTASDGTTSANASEENSA